MQQEPFFSRKKKITARSVKFLEHGCTHQQLTKKNDKAVDYIKPLVVGSWPNLVGKEGKF